MEFIVTCGTSQIGNIGRLGTKKLDPHSLCVAMRDDGYKDLETTYLQRGAPEDLTPDFMSAAEPVAARVAKFLWDFMQQGSTPGVIGDENNPLGAELSTLFIFLKKYGQFSGVNHKFHVLSSDTRLGWLNALILIRVIEGGWGRAGEPILVQNLRVKPAPTPDPLYSLSMRLKDILAQSREEPPHIIMSGGFKSVIPCLTMYSAIFALPLIYLFESTNQIKEIRPVQEVKNRKESRKSWSDLSNINIAQNIPWLQVALDFRTKVPIGWL